MRLNSPGPLSDLTPILVRIERSLYTTAGGVGSGGAPWILATGFWVDTSPWADAQSWND